MKRTFIMMAMSLLLLVLPMKASAQSERIYRNMFPVAEMAEEMTDALDYELNLTNSQYDEIFFYYYDWIEDVLDRMEYDGLFPMSARTFDRYVETGCRYFYDTDSAFRARKRFFRNILLRYQYKKWLSMEEENRYGRVNVYVYAFPRFSYYDARLHRHYIYHRPPRPYSYHRHDYHPTPGPGYGPRHPYNPPHVGGRPHQPAQPPRPDYHPAHPVQPAAGGKPGGAAPSQQPAQPVPPSTSQGNRNHNSPGSAKPAGSTPSQRPSTGSSVPSKPATGSTPAKPSTGSSKPTPSKPASASPAKPQRTTSTATKGNSSSNSSSSSSATNSNRTNPVKR